MMNTIPYFMGDNGLIIENGEQKKSLISFAETDEEIAKAQKEIDFNKEKITADNKLYLILFAGYIGDSEEIDYKQWDYVEGRENAYKVIKETFLTPELKDKGVTLDAYQSRIIVQTNNSNLKLTGISVYKFVSTMIREGKIVDEDGTFDIEEWAVDAGENTD